jgi:hypothetical protein
MHRRPKLTEAIEVLRSLSPINEDALQAIVDYNDLVAQGQEFVASRMVVDIVDHYYHLLDLKGIAHG